MQDNFVFTQCSLFLYSNIYPLKYQALCTGNFSWIKHKNNAQHENRKLKYEYTVRQSNLLKAKLEVEVYGKQDNNNIVGR